MEHFILKGHAQAWAALAAEPRPSTRCGGQRNGRHRSSLPLDLVLEPMDTAGTSADVRHSQTWGSHPTARLPVLDATDASGVLPLPPPPPPHYHSLSSRCLPRPAAMGLPGEEFGSQFVMLNFSDDEASDPDRSRGAACSPPATATAAAAASPCRQGPAPVPPPARAVSPVRPADHDPMGMTVVVVPCRPRGAGGGAGTSGLRGEGTTDSEDCENTDALPAGVSRGPAGSRSPVWGAGDGAAGLPTHMAPRPPPGAAADARPAARRQASRRSLHAASAASTGDGGQESAESPDGAQAAAKGPATPPGASDRDGSRGAAAAAAAAAPLEGERHVPASKFLSPAKPSARRLLPPLWLASEGASSGGSAPPDLLSLNSPAEHDYVCLGLISDETLDLVARTRSFNADAPARGPGPAARTGSGMLPPMLPMAHPRRATSGALTHVAPAWSSDQPPAIWHTAPALASATAISSDPAVRAVLRSMASGDVELAGAGPQEAGQHAGPKRVRPGRLLRAVTFQGDTEDVHAEEGEEEAGRGGQGWRPEAETDEGYGAAAAARALFAAASQGSSMDALDAPPPLAPLGRLARPLPPLISPRSRLLAG